MSTRKQGDVGETFAVKLLEKHGYTVICRNYTCRGGEIDIVATKDNYICFSEVKLRAVLSGNKASDAVDSVKLSRIKTAAEFFLEEYKDNLYISSLKPRFDIIELYTTPQNSVIKHNHIIDIN